MAKNDFLYPLFSLPPFIVYLVVLIWGFGSILLLAIKTKAVKNILLKNPGFIVGDFFLLPAGGGLITFFYQSVSEPLLITTSHLWHLLSFAISLGITLGTGLRYKLIQTSYIIGLPHGLFHLFFTYLFLTFISKGFWQLIFGESSITLWIVWAAAIVTVLFHLLLGTIWPKRIPFE